MAEPLWPVSNQAALTKLETRLSHLADRLRRARLRSADDSANWLERAEDHYRRALALAEPRGMRPLIAQCYRGLAQIYCRGDKRRVAEECRTAATTMYRDMGMAHWLAKAEMEMRELT
jgi:hypothetical protein